MFSHLFRDAAHTDKQIPSVSQFTCWMLLISDKMSSLFVTRMRTLCQFNTIRANCLRYGSRNVMLAFSQRKQITSLFCRKYSFVSRNRIEKLDHRMYLQYRCLCKYRLVSFNIWKLNTYMTVCMCFIPVILFIYFWFFIVIWWVSQALLRA